MTQLCVVIPAYNEECAIADTIREYKLAFPEARIIVVDNNSTDRTNVVARATLDPQADLLPSGGGERDTRSRRG
jgi:glycosyltransferase involved in cell wall biosynthesis